MLLYLYLQEFSKNTALSTVYSLATYNCKQAGEGIARSPPVLLAAVFL